MTSTAPATIDPPRTSAHPPGRPARNPRLWLVLLALVPGLAAALAYEGRALELAQAHGFPLDDAWIHAQFARNLATGHGFSYTGDRWVAGSTAPAWTLLWALVQLVVPNAVIGAKVAGLALQALSAALAVRVALWLTGHRLTALTAGVVVSLSPIMVWGAVSGMEVTLAGALTLAALDRHLRDRRQPSWRGARGVALAALACLARPECLLLVVVLLADLTWAGLVPGTPVPGTARRWRRALPGTVATCAVVVVLGSWVAFNERTTGLPLPTTFYVKSGPGIVRALQTADYTMAGLALTVHGPGAIIQFLHILIDQFGPAAWLVPVGIIGGLARRSTRAAACVLLAMLIIGPYVMGITAPQRLKPDNVRYAPHLVVLAGIAAALSLPALSALPWRVPAVRNTVAGLLALALVASTAARTVGASGFYALSVKNIEELHVRLGRWLHVSLPAGATIATNDIGAIAFFSEHPVLDIEGLVSPEALVHRGPGRGLKVVEDGRPDYVAFFPHWYPEIAADPRFPEVCRVSISDNYVSGGDTFIVARTPWSRSEWPAVPRPGEMCR